MDTAPKIVLQNPYRILGVYANSAKKDIVANKGKATAFVRVGKPVEFPLDLKGILPVLNRTLDLMNEAEAHLAIAKEQIKYAQFWFLKMNPIDDVAFNHLVAGNLTQAKEIWSKQESLSSLQNKLVCYLIEDKPWLALKIAEKLYEKFGESYINKVDANCTLQMSGTELLHQFIDSLGEEVGMQELLGYESGAKTKAYISSQTVGPLIKKISTEVEKAKKVDHEDSKARLDAARKLVASTKEAFTQLKNILPANDSQFQIIADKLGLEILQCGIDYFNNSTGNGRHRTAMKIQKYALSIVVGTLAKQRCEENINILQGLIDKLPPEEVKNEQEHILQRIALFMMFPGDVDGVLKFLKDTCDDLVAIKEKLGKQHSFYQQQATLVAQTALGKSIDILNEIQDEEFSKLNGIGRNAAVKKLSHAFAASWEAMLWIELIDADAEFKEHRLKPNKVALKKILDQVDAFDSSSILSRFSGGSYSVFEGCARGVEVDRYIYFTEQEMYAICKSISSCRKYIEKFPHGIHIEKVREKLEQLEDDQLFANAKTISDLNNYLVKYPKGRHQKEARTKITTIEEQHRRQREEEISNLSRQIDSCKSIKNCISLKLQSDKYKSKLLDKELDDKFFSLCSSIEDYQEYLTRIGHFGQHAKEAEKVIRQHKMIKNILLVILITVSIFLFGWLISHFSKEEARIRKEEARKEAERIEQMNNMFEQAVNSIDAELCLDFLSTYPNSSNELRDSVQAVLGRAIEMKADSLLANHYNEENFLQWFVNFYSSNSYTNDSPSIDKVRKRIHEIEEQKAKEEEKARQRKEQEMYGTDAKAWNTATNINTLAAYQDYLRRYPKGKHIDAANKRIIDIEVQQVINSGDYGDLPSSQKISSGTGSKSTIHIRSRCDRRITIMYSGINSMKIELSPYESRTVYLKSGNYKVVATAPGVRPFYGTENLTGGDYESEYYISTSRY